MKESFKTEYKASVKIDPTNEPYLAHNDRTDDRAKNIYKELSHLNEYHIFNDNNESVKDMHERLYQQAKDTYMSKSKRKDKFTDKKATLVEAIYELTPETSKEQVIALTQEIAKMTGFTPLHIAIHKDEGHITENNTFQKHYHAHAVFFTLDKDTGKQLKRQQAALTKENLATMQDLAVKHLSTSNYQMQRGERRYEHNKEVFQSGVGEYKHKVYEKDIKIHAKNQAIEQRERILNAKNNKLNTREQNIANREYEQNMKDKKADEVMSKVKDNLYKKATGFFKSMFKDFKPQDLRTIVNAIAETAEKDYETREQQKDQIHQQEIKQITDEIKLMKQQNEFFAERYNTELAQGTKEIDTAKMIKRYEEHKQQISPKLSKTLKDYDR